MSSPKNINSSIPDQPTEMAMKKKTHTSDLVEYTLDTLYYTNQNKNNLLLQAILRNH